MLKTGIYCSLARGNLRVVKVVFSFLAFLCFLAEQKTCLTNFSEKLKARKANKRYLLCQILRNFNRRKFKKSDKDFSIFSPQKQLHHQNRNSPRSLCGMRAFSNHRVLSMSDSTMAVSSKYTQDLSVQIVFFTFSFKWFLCF